MATVAAYDDEETLLRAVDHVGDVDTTRPQDPVDVLDELRRCEVPRHRPTRECIAHDDIGTVVGQVAERLAAVADDHVDARARSGDTTEFLGDHVDQLPVDLQHGLLAARARRLHVRGHGHRATADVDDVDRSGRAELLDRIDDPADVPELEMCGIVEIDVAVSEVVEHERASARPIVVLADRDAVVRGLRVARAAECNGDGKRAAGRPTTSR